MRRHDRLAWLAATHGVLRQAGIRTVNEHGGATPSQLVALGVYRATIRELASAGYPDVMRALWPPQDITWEGARESLYPGARLLSVSRAVGATGFAGESIVSLVYRVDDGGADERRALLVARCLA